MLKHVIIVGGGVAGLSAAGELHGCRVTLLEAKDRFGGRIQSLRTAAGVVELGAEFIHGQSRPLIEAIRAANLTTCAVSNRNQLFESGSLQPVEVWGTFGELTQRIDPQARDRSFRAFLDEQSLDERTRRMMLAFAEGFNAAHADRLSAHALRRADYAAHQINGAEQRRVEEGYGALVDALATKARKAGATLLNEAVVRRVRWSPGRVELEVARGDTLETFFGDAAIITLPLGVLKAGTVTFDPPLVDKAEAVAGLEFGHVVKVTLVFREHWWPEPDFGFIHTLDEPIVTWWSNAHGPLLTGWAGGSKAGALLAHSPAQLEVLAIQILQRLFSVPAAMIHSQLVATHAHNWASDPHVRGAYSYIPVNGLFLPKLLGSAVEGTLFFAGEATARDAQMGTVFGALESGQRAASEVLESRQHF